MKGVYIEQGIIVRQRKVASRRPGVAKRCYPAGTLVQPLFQLRSLLRAGLPLTEALRQVSALEPAGARSALWVHMADEVAAGKSLSQVLVERPREFDSTAVALIRAGEASGRLDELLGEFEAHLSWRQDVSHRLRTVMLYPLFAMLVLVAVIGFLLGHVVPSLAAFLEHGGQPLAWHAELLLNLSSAVGLHGPAVSVGVILPLAGLVSARHLGRSLHAMRDRCLLHLGVVGRLIAALCAARWARTTSLLHQSGVELGDALEISADVVGNEAMRLDLLQARAGILAGKGAGPALMACPSLPASLSRLVAAGESAGVLDAALMQGAEHLQATSNHAIARLEALLAPVLLAATGAILLWIILSVLAPLYSSFGAEAFL